MTLDPTKVKKTAKGKDIITVTRTELAAFFHRTSGENNIYSCPFCAHRGHTGTGYKLFMNELRGIGWCHVCQLILVYEESYDLGNEVQQFVKTFKEKDEPPEWWDVNSWTIAASESPEIRNYVDTRKIKYSDQVLDRYHIRLGRVTVPDLNNVGLFITVPVMMFPNDFKDEKTDFFQYKCLDPTISLPKYVTICSAPLVWLESNALSTKQIIIVEGLFDAIAVQGCAMTGKTLSDKQQRQLRDFCLHHPEVEQVIVAPDNDLSQKEQDKLMKTTKSLVGDIPLFKATIPSNCKDPEDVVAARLTRRVFVEDLEAA